MIQLTLSRSFTRWKYKRTKLRLASWLFWATGSVSKCSQGAFIACWSFPTTTDRVSNLAAGKLCTQTEVAPLGHVFAFKTDLLVLQKHLKRTNLGRKWRLMKGGKAMLKQNAVLRHKSAAGGCCPQIPQAEQRQKFAENLWGMGWPRSWQCHGKWLFWSHGHQNWSQSHSEQSEAICVFFGLEFSFASALNHSISSSSRFPQVHEGLVRLTSEEICQWTFPNSQRLMPLGCNFGNHENRKEEIPIKFPTNWKDFRLFAYLIILPLLEANFILSWRPSNSPTIAAHTVLSAVF